ncbi:hypothetical protein K466DRAFT_454103, partial [Polyporus arcularius HHB13444]
GKWFPRCDDDGTRDFYCASMLMLLKPWRRLSDLKVPHRTWRESFEDFLATADSDTHFILDGIQYFHECK